MYDSRKWMENCRGVFDFDIGGSSVQGEVPPKKKRKKQKKKRNPCTDSERESELMLFEMVSLGCRWCFGVSGANFVRAFYSLLLPKIIC
jgi:hypothetical protein